MLLSGVLIIYQKEEHRRQSEGSLVQTEERLLREVYKLLLSEWIESKEKYVSFGSRKSVKNKL